MVDLGVNGVADVAAIRLIRCPLVSEPGDDHTVGFDPEIPS